MKEAYTTPEMEITAFACEDVITTSTPVPDPDEVPVI